MKIFIDGHDFHYEMQALAMLFSQGRRVQVVREAPAALPEEALYTGLRAEGDG